MQSTTQNSDIHIAEGLAHSSIGPHGSVVGLRSFSSGNGTTTTCGVLWKLEKLSAPAPGCTGDVLVNHKLYANNKIDENGQIQKYSTYEMFGFTLDNTSPYSQFNRRCFSPNVVIEINGNPIAEGRSL